MKIVYLIILIFVILMLCKKYHNMSANRRRSVGYNKRIKVLTELLEVVLMVEKISNTRPFALYGTLLGLEREGKFICYDYDVDFGILTTEFDTFLEDLLTSIDTIKYEVIVRNNVFQRQLKIVDKETGLNLDIDSMYIEGDYVKKEDDGIKLYNKFMYPEECAKIKKDSIFPLRKKTLDIHSVYVPNNIPDVLRCFYGDNYMTPDHECSADCSVCKKKH
jgi:hypothetical protein